MKKDAALIIYPDIFIRFFMFYYKIRLRGYTSFCMKNVNINDGYESHLWEYIIRTDKKATKNLNNNVCFDKSSFAR